MCGKESKKQITAISLPREGEAGKTGTWRTRRPVLIVEKCIAAKGKDSCYRCWLFCPDSAISRTQPPVVDLDYCKGCGICAEECPTKALKMVDEAKAKEEN